MIDVVAEAIWSSPANKRVVSWTEMDDKTKELWRADARRVLQAMREPTEEMIAAIKQTQSLFAGQFVREAVFRDWQAMIDAALEGK